MSIKKSAPIDSVGVFLREVSRKSGGVQGVPESGTTDDAADTVLDRLAREGHDLDLEVLHNKIRNLSITRLNRAVVGLEEAGLVAVDPDTDTVSLTERGRTAASLHLAAGRPDK